MLHDGACIRVSKHNDGILETDMVLRKLQVSEILEG